MLVLKVNMGEDVVLTLPDGRTMSVMLVETGYGFGRLGFEAPRDVNIVRREVLKRNEKASKENQP